MQELTVSFPKGVENLHLDHASLSGQWERGSPRPYGASLRMAFEVGGPDGG